MSLSIKMTLKIDFDTTRYFSNRIPHTKCFNIYALSIFICNNRGIVIFRIPSESDSLIIHDIRSQTDIRRNEFTVIHLICKPVELSGIANLYPLGSVICHCRCRLIAFAVFIRTGISPRLFHPCTCTIRIYLISLAEAVFIIVICFCSKRHQLLLPDQHIDHRKFHTICHLYAVSICICFRQYRCIDIAVSVADFAAVKGCSVTFSFIQLPCYTGELCGCLRGICCICIIRCYAVSTLRFVLYLYGYCQCIRKFDIRF